MGATMHSRRNQFALFARMVFRDVSGNGAGGNGEWARQIHLTGPTTTGEISVLRANHDLIRAGGNAWPSIDAGPAARFDYVRSGSLENVQITFSHAVLASFLRSELNVELN